MTSSHPQKIRIGEFYWLRRRDLNMFVVKCLKIEIMSANGEKKEVTEFSILERERYILSSFDQQRNIREPFDSEKEHGNLKTSKLASLNQNISDEKIFCNKKISINKKNVRNYNEISIQEIKNDLDIRQLNTVEGLRKHHALNNRTESLKVIVTVELENHELYRANIFELLIFNPTDRLFKAMMRISKYRNDIYIKRILFNLNYQHEDYMKYEQEEINTFDMHITKEEFLRLYKEYVINDINFCDISFHDVENVIVSGTTDMSVYSLYKKVCENGGMERITEDQKWKSLFYSEMSKTNVSYTIRTFYKKYLYEFEYNRREKPDEENFQYKFNIKDNFYFIAEDCKYYGTIKLRRNRGINQYYIQFHGWSRENNEWFSEDVLFPYRESLNQSNRTRRKTRSSKANNLIDDPLTREKHSHLSQKTGKSASENINEEIVLYQKDKKEKGQIFNNQNDSKNNDESRNILQNDEIEYDIYKNDMKNIKIYKNTNTQGYYNIDNHQKNFNILNQNIHLNKENPINYQSEVKNRNFHQVSNNNENEHPRHFFNSYFFEENEDLNEEKKYQNLKNIKIYQNIQKDNETSLLNDQNIKKSNKDNESFQNTSRNNVYNQKISIHRHFIDTHDKTDILSEKIKFETPISPVKNPKCENPAGFPKNISETLLDSKDNKTDNEMVKKLTEENKMGRHKKEVRIKKMSKILEKGREEAKKRKVEQFRKVFGEEYKIDEWNWLFANVFDLK